MMEKFALFLNNQLFIDMVNLLIIHQPGENV